ncbi:MAG: AMP-binding protein, partial [Deltaproteobacteria bacterium]|nr:AMP-binding protein [Deltaproteobacteria bacterium]
MNDRTKKNLYALGSLLVTGDVVKPWIKHYDPHVPPNIEYPPVPLTRILDDTADHFPEALAVFFFGGKIRYGTLRTEANQFAAALQGMGFKKGERLGILLPNMPQAIISTFGALKAGGTAVFFDPLADKEELRQQIHHAGIETLVVLDLVLPRVDPVFGQSKLKNFIICRVKDYLPFTQNSLFSLAARGKGLNIKVAKKPNIHLFREFLARVPPNSSVPAGGEGGSEEVAVIQYTSGPAGGPQGSMFSHKNLIAGIHQISA